MKLKFANIYIYLPTFLVAITAVTAVAAIVSDVHALLLFFSNGSCCAYVVATVAVVATSIVARLCH